MAAYVNGPTGRGAPPLEHVIPDLHPAQFEPEPTHCEGLRRAAVHIGDGMTLEQALLAVWAEADADADAPTTRQWKKRRLPPQDYATTS